MLAPTTPTNKLMITVHVQLLLRAIRHLRWADLARRRNREHPGAVNSPPASPSRPGQDVQDSSPACWLCRNYNIIVFPGLATGARAGKMKRLEKR